MTPTMEDSFKRIIVKSVETITTKDVVKDITSDDSVIDAELKAFKFNSYTLPRQQFDASTVINIHNQAGCFSITVPVAALRSEKVDVHAIIANNSSGITNVATFTVGADIPEQVFMRFYETKIANAFQTQPMIHILSNTH